MKNFFLKTGLTLLCLIIGLGSAWGETYSFTPDKATTGNSATAYVTSAYSFTYNNIGWSFNQWNPSTLQIKTNQASATNEFNFKNTNAFPGKITSVVITFKALTVSDASKLCFVGGSSAISSLSGGTGGTWNSTAKTLTWTPESTANYTYFAFFQNGKAASGTNYLAEANAIVVTYENSTTKTLSSIAVKTAPTQTTYTEGEHFNPAGLVITGTYSDASTEDIAYAGHESNFSFNPALTTALTTSNTSVTITYNGQTANQPITVKGQASGEATVTFDNLGYTSWGKTAQFSGSTYNEVSQSKSDVTFTYTRNTGSLYANISAIRFYKANELTFTAPDGYKITSISWSGSNFTNDVTTDVATCTSTTSALSWSGNAASVTFTRPSNASSYITLSSVTVKLVKDGDTPTPTITAESTLSLPATESDGTFDVTWTNVEEYDATLYADAACTSKIEDCDWLIIDLNSSSKNIDYYVSANTSTSPRTVYMQLYGLASDGTTDATKVVTITQAGATPVYASLAALVADGAPTATAKKVTVTLTDEEITAMTNSSITLTSGTQNVQIYCSGRPSDWAIGGTVSGTLTECDWVLYNNSVWELMPANWNELNYTAPAQIPEYASLAELIADGAPTTSGKTVTVTLTNETITRKVSNGIFVQVGDQEIELYKTGLPSSWQVGGTISGTLTNCTWQDYYGTWELCPTSWDELSYTAPLPNLPNFIKNAAVTVYVGHTYNTTDYLNIPADYDCTPYTITTTINGLTEKDGEYACVYPNVAFQTTGTYTVHVLAPATDKYAQTEGDIVFTVINESVTYNVTVDNTITNGTVTANPTTASEGDTVTLTVTPATGYTLGTLTVTNATTSAPITVTSNTFIMPAANVNVTATFEEEAAPGSYTYNLVTDASTLAAGDVIVLGSTFTKSGTETSVAAGPFDGQSYLSVVEASVTDGIITSAGAIELTIGGSTGAWTLATSNGTIGTTEAKKMNENGSGTTTWTISITEGNASITSTNSSYGTIKYNSNAPRFLNYTSGQTAIQIYKKTLSTPKTLTSISLDGQTTTFTVGDTFAFGGTVTAHYDDESTKNVTSSATFSGYDMSTASTQTVTVSYTENEVNKTATYDITVSEAVHGEYVLTPLADINETDEVIITMTNSNGTYALYNDNGTTKAPTAVSVTVSNKSISSPDATILWNISQSDGVFTAYVKGDNTKWLYCISDNNGLRVGTNDNKTFTIDNNYMKHVATERYIGVYNNQDFRSYTSINSNITGQTLAFYVKAVAPKTLRSITLDGQTTTFTEGDEFAFGGTVTAHYDDESTKDVTTSATFSGYDMSILDTEQTVTVSYTEGGVTKEASYNIIVNAATKYTVTIIEPENGTLVVKHGEETIASGTSVVSGTVLTIEATPADGYDYQNWQYKVEGGSWVTKYTNYDYTVDSNVSFRANFEPIVTGTFTINYSVNGIIRKTETLDANASLNFPAVSSMYGKVFLGWTTSEVPDEVDVQPETVGAIKATTDATYYALFATKNTTAGSDELTKVDELVAGMDVILAMEEAGTPSKGISGVDNEHSTAIVSTDPSEWVKFTVNVIGENTCLAYGTQYVTPSDKKENKFKLTDDNGTNFYIDNHQLGYTTDYDYILAENHSTSAGKDEYFYRFYKTSTVSGNTNPNQVYTPFFVYTDGSSTTYSAYTTLPSYVKLDESITNGTYENETFGTVKIIRSMKADDTWNSLCLPFSMNEEQITTAFGEDTDVRELTTASVTGTAPDEVLHLNFTQVTAIEAGKLYMVRVPAAITEFYVEDTEVNTAEPVQDYSKGDYTIQAHSNYNYMDGTTNGYVPVGSFVISSNKFMQVGSSTQKMKAFRGYITATDASGNPVKALGIGFIDPLTGINNVEFNTDARIYNLQGLQQSKVQKGINIVNGKKIIR